jgi:hypothetical protein
MRDRQRKPPPQLRGCISGHQGRALLFFLSLSDPDWRRQLDACWVPYLGQKETRMYCVLMAGPGWSRVKVDVAPSPSPPPHPLPRLRPCSHSPVGGRIPSTQAKWRSHDPRHSRSLSSQSHPSLDLLLRVIPHPHPPLIFSSTTPLIPDGEGKGRTAGGSPTNTPRSRRRVGVTGSKRLDTYRGISLPAGSERCRPRAGQYLFPSV